MSIVNYYNDNLYDAINGLQFLKFSIHGGGDGGLLAMLDSLLTFFQEASFSGNPTDLLPGLANMANIHPLIVHFPIALLTSFLLMEIMALLFSSDKLHVASSWMLYIGTLGAAATVVAGFMAASTVPHGSAAHAIIASHKSLGLTVLGLSVVLTLWRMAYKQRLSGMASVLNIILAVIMVGLLTKGADLGGQMVYKYGVGVSSIEPPKEHQHTGHSHSH